ncbi:MAG: ActS/PrrB/RegB family redox-sensitive histidine kinase [Alphaproteobacteria bacterium]
MASFSDPANSATGGNGAPAVAATALDKSQIDMGRPARVRARTLVLIRWIAVTGQAITVLVVHYLMGFHLPIDLAMMTVAASAALNLVLTWRTQRHLHLGDREATWYLAFDVLQLATLLQLTGGLLNPFSILLMGPLTIAATILSRFRMILLWALCVACISVLAVWHEPLPWQGAAPPIPTVYVLGLWVALVLGASLIAAYGWRVAEDARRLSNALGATQLALDREHRVSELGAMAAATAHELGSPLSTIAVAVKELSSEALADAPDHVRDDLQLLTEQVARCRDILASLGRLSSANAGEALLRFETLPLSQLMAELGQKFADDGTGPGVAFDVDRHADKDNPEPVVRRTPELMHGLGNLVQNALQFARHRVVAEIRWSATSVEVRLLDDGPGFPPAILARLGEPYLSSRSGTGEHLGLGIFIAETLLGRMGATLDFANPSPASRKGLGGARVTILWPREALDVTP